VREFESVAGCFRRFIPGGLLRVIDQEDFDRTFRIAPVVVMGSESSDSEVR